MLVKVSPKLINLYYQDCPDCGRRKAWAEAQYKVATEHGFQIHKISFVEPGADEVIIRAARSGVSVPFFSDGEKFAKDLSAFIPTANLSAEAVVNSCPVKSGARKTKKAKVKDGARA